MSYIYNIFWLRNNLVLLHKVIDYKSFFITKNSLQSS